MTATVLTDTSDMRLPHGMFRDSLASAAAIVPTVGDDPERADAVVRFCREVVAFLHCHHGAEDAILWPLLRERATDHSDLLDRMEAQHAGVGEMSEKFDRAINEYVKDPSGQTADALAAAIRSLRAELDAHLTDEEREILPLAAVTVTPDEWGSMPGWAMSHFDGPMWLVIGLILEQMTSDERTAFLGHVPPPVADMWNGGGSAEFGAFTALVRNSRPVPVPAS